MRAPDKHFLGWPAGAGVKMRSALSRPELHRAASAAAPDAAGWKLE